MFIIENNGLFMWNEAAVLLSNVMESYREAVRKSWNRAQKYDLWTDMSETSNDFTTKLIEVYLHVHKYCTFVNIFCIKISTLHNSCIKVLCNSQISASPFAHSKGKFFKCVIPGLFNLYVWSLQTNIKIFTTLCVKKCPSSIWCMDLNPRPFGGESPPITTRQVHLP